jgi:hypothetical protein
VTRSLGIVIGVPAVAAVLGAASGGAAFAYGAFWVSAFGVVIWALLDAMHQPDASWSQVGANRTTLLGVLVGGALLCGLIGYIAAIYYFTTIRPRLQDAHWPHRTNE